eukprot:CAMPEP_0195041586 /NCGR_PEP_ID=MMETSP0347-20130606/941_1 /TAXON_ID=2932 /ORGANISM="Alexandrium fundyense, Strain CCMP1719" /LENGTH=39 /DNA_ID= /DNA_START= /DNA_END= /DNA_ORIENTATION=
MASRPLASSEFSFLVLAAGSELVSTLNPKSPGVPSVPKI